MNTVCITGRLTDNITLKKTNSGLSVCNFTVATPRKKDETDFIRCSAWSKLADLMEKYTGKGCQIGITGRLSTRSYTNREGQKVSTMEVVAEDVTFIDFKKREEEKDDLDGFVNLAEDLDDLFGGE